MFRESEAADLGLAGRVALVTGGTRGVGRAVARRLCAAGCHVVLNYANSADQARRTVEELSGLKGSATAVSGDISRPKALAAVLDTVHRDHGGLDIFVHNASSWHPMATLHPDGGGFRADLATALTPLVFGAPALLCARRRLRQQHKRRQQRRSRSHAAPSRRSASARRSESGSSS